MHLHSPPLGWTLSDLRGQKEAELPVDEMNAKILDGQDIAKQVLEELKSPLAELSARGRKLKITCLQIGESGPSAAYTRGIKRNCDAIGIGFELLSLPTEIAPPDVLSTLADLGRDDSVTGVMIQFPLPDHLDGRTLQAHIPPGKDVEAITPTSLGRLLLGESRVAPCTALSSIRLLDATETDLAGAEVVVVGMSEIVGKPTALLLLDRFATTTVCHVKTRELSDHTRRADVLIVAAGSPGLIRGDMIRPGAIVIDIGYTPVKVRGENGEIRTQVQGDVVFSEAVDVASWMTPVPGGVGPVTRAMLMRNAVTTVQER